MRWLAALVVATVVAQALGCTTPVAPTDGGADAGLDAATPATDGGDRDAPDDASAIDAFAADMGTSDAGVDAGPTGPLEAHGALGTSGGPSSNGALTVVDDGFDVSGMTCNGALCAWGGFR